ncbi:hypothetical protein Y032_0223g2661 [Ancylostoma ceylanicum]|uniref:Uncharacterized protein n=1 Tax=Ancylostoma ceylanicum TaxID=53326 RepID=A0A016SIG4_9BILA|nr:hypothetical protein Y032_0223g2661 [Ancylostoma ceylanicum]
MPSRPGRKGVELLIRVRKQSVLSFPYSKKNTSAQQYKKKCRDNSVGVAIVPSSPSLSERILLLPEVQKLPSPM